MTVRTNTIFLRTLIDPCLTARTKKYHIKTAIHVEKAELFVLNDWIFYSSKFCPCLPIFFRWKMESIGSKLRRWQLLKSKFLRKIIKLFNRDLAARFSAARFWPVATLSGIFQNVEVKLIFWKCIFTLRLSI
jgi:hypothetical protein